MFKFTKSILVAAAACVIPLASYAGPVTNNPSLSIDGLNFGGFSCSISKGGIAATPNNCGQINVNAITSPGVGLEFTSGFTAAPLSFDDAVIDYHVSSGAGINSVGLDFNGTFWGLAIASVTESVFSGNQLVGFAQVSCGTDVGCNRTDTITLDGAYTTYILRKISMFQASLVPRKPASSTKPLAQMLPSRLLCLSSAPVLLASLHGCAAARSRQIGEA